MKCVIVLLALTLCGCAKEIHEARSHGEPNLVAAVARPYLAPAGPAFTKDF